MNQADLKITRFSNLSNWLIGSIINSRGRVAYSSRISTITPHLKCFTSHCSRRKMFYNNPYKKFAYRNYIEIIRFFTYNKFIKSVYYIQSTLYKCTPLGTEHKCAFKEGVHL